MSDTRRTEQEGAAVERMDERTLTALKGSIEKWRAIEAGAGIDDGWRNCPLCQLFNNSQTEEQGLSCAGCPVSARVVTPGCDETPYEEWVTRCAGLGVYPRRASNTELVALAHSEREFLESLLPRTTTPDSRAPLPITRSSNEQSPDEARDAARYRWLRENYVTIKEQGWVRTIGKWSADLDAAIDAAIAEQDGKGGERS